MTEKDKERMQKIYNESLEDWPMATEEIKAAYEHMRDKFDEYIAAIKEYAFFYGYECARRKAGDRHV